MKIEGTETTVSVPHLLHQLLYPWGWIRTEQTHLFRHGASWVLLFNSFAMWASQPRNTEGEGLRTANGIILLQSRSSLPPPLHRHLVTRPLDLNLNHCLIAAHMFIREMDYMWRVAAIKFIVTIPLLIVDFLRTSLEETKKEGEKSLQLTATRWIFVCPQVV